MSDIQFPATFMAHWPSQDVPMCEKHQLAGKKLGNDIGLWIHVAPLAPGHECVNCIHEAVENARTMEQGPDA